MQFVISFCIVLICTFASTTHGSLKTEIAKACGKRPGFTAATNQAISAVGAALKLTIGKGYDRCHTLSFQTIRTKVCDDFPTVTPLCPVKVNRWRRNMDTLNQDLHTIDSEWFLYSKMKANKAAFKKFDDTNDANEDKVDDSLDKVVANIGSSDTVLAGKIKAVLRFMNSATANLRPGKDTINRSIGGHLDPLLKIKATGKVTARLLTTHSKVLESSYPTTWKMRVGSIMTSDKP